MKKLRIKKELGIWYYKKIMPDIYNDLDGPVYELYDKNKKFVAMLSYYSDMWVYAEYEEESLKWL